ncbi:MAG: hypothetical protein AABY13_03240 [Nanoarchaeota archaeon]
MRETVTSRTIPNRGLALLLLLTMAVSIGGSYMIVNQTVYVTGMFSATNTNGTVTFTQEGVLSIRLNDALTTFGNITSTAPGDCKVNTEGGAPANCTAELTTDYMQLENDGNVVAAVLVNSTKDKNQTFSLGSTGTQQFRGASPVEEPGSCASGLASTYTLLPNASQDRAVLCSALRHNNTEDALTIHYQLFISPDLAPGNQTENVTFWATVA